MKFENGNVIPGSHTNGMSGIDMTNEYRIVIKRDRRNFSLAIFIEKNLNATKKLTRKYERHRAEHTKKFIMCILCANKNITTPFVIQILITSGWSITIRCWHFQEIDRNGIFNPSYIGGVF